jgi:large subunit ribosomal protein L24
MNRIKTGDEVIVITGKDKGHRGKVLKVDLENDCVFVEGAHLQAKTIKPNPQQKTKAGIIKKEGRLHISNVAHYNPATKKGEKIGFKYLENGNKVRYFKSNNEVIDRV